MWGKYFSFLKTNECDENIVILPRIQKLSVSQHEKCFMAKKIVVGYPVRENGSKQSFNHDLNERLSKSTKNYW